MTNEQLRQNAAAMLAFADGKPIQYNNGTEDRLWTNTSSPNWMLSQGVSYRPKPEPALRPWSRDTMPSLPFEVRAKTTQNRMVVVLANEKCVRLGNVNVDLTYAELLEKYTLSNGSPCGVTE